MYKRQALSDKLDAKDKEIEALKKAPAAPAVKPVTATKTEEVVTSPLERYAVKPPEELRASYQEHIAKTRAEAKAKA